VRKLTQENQYGPELNALFHDSSPADLNRLTEPIGFAGQSTHWRKLMINMDGERFTHEKMQSFGEKVTDDAAFHTRVAARYQRRLHPSCRQWF
jgi:hypothetical protein